MTDLSWLRAELGGLYGAEVIREMSEIIRLYELYEGRGREDARLKTNLIRKLIREESRFMAGRAPELRVIPEDGNAECALGMERFLERLLEENGWRTRLIRGVRDCFIGKRVALALGCAPGRPLTIRFIPSTEFVYEPDEDGALAKIIFFYGLNDLADRARQRVYRKKLWMDGGRCLIDEGIYDGYGRLIERRHEAEDTGLDFIPCYVIVNGSLTGDLSGESDVAELCDNQAAYDALRSDDLDALKYNMFPQKVFVDASQEAIEHVVIAPGALIDLATDPSRMGSGQASARMLESSFSYDERFEHAVSRVRADMFDTVSVPEMNLETLKGFAASGKAMRAVYWGLICRCEEKWAEWDDALRWMVRRIFDIAGRFGLMRPPETRYAIRIEHLYPIPDGEEEERERDMKEVTGGVRSRASYIAKWQPDENPDIEMERIRTDEQKRE